MKLFSRNLTRPHITRGGNGAWGSVRIASYAIKATKGTKKSKGSSSGEISMTLDKPYKLHRVTDYPEPSDSVTTTGEELISFYKQMQTVRRLEVACDQQYKQRNIRGFLHLYNGQEAVCVGMEAGIKPQDHVITAYRDHGHQLVRGDSVERIMAELFGKATGCSGGKGGSMHMYLAEKNFWGGNGIVGAQVPIGAGLALAAKTLKQDRVSLSFYGDGAANQGQLFEAFNMAKLWNLPAIFVCENNHYGMGTAADRAAASIEYYTRGDYIPGIWVDGMNVLAAKEGFRWAREFALSNGPIVVEMETYRYVGHSMSDPGIAYRTKDEVSNVKDTRDPIKKVRNWIIEHKVADEDQIKGWDKDIKKAINEAVKFANTSPWPEAGELFTHIVCDGSIPTKGRVRPEDFTPQ